MSALIKVARAVFGTTITVKQDVEKQFYLFYQLLKIEECVFFFDGVNCIPLLLCNKLCLIVIWLCVHNLCCAFLRLACIVDAFFRIVYQLRMHGSARELDCINVSG